MIEQGEAWETTGGEMGSRWVGGWGMRNNRRLKAIVLLHSSAGIALG
jgi:hypothetical protein